jgi:hypothetical protein
MGSTGGPQLEMVRERTGTEEKSFLGTKERKGVSWLATQRRCTDCVSFVGRFRKLSADRVQH